VWIKRSGNGSWTDAANWQGGAIANGEDKTANISTLNITANRTISLDRSRTIGHILAADMKPSHSWTIDAGTPAGVLTLAVSTGVPVIDVSSKTLAISAVIAGDDGLCKKGNGTLTLSGANTLTGPIVISNTTLSIMTAATALADARLIDICDGATCDVSAVSGFTIGAAQTLQGKGVLVGTAMVNGTNAPGGDTIGRLTVNGAVCMGTSAVCVMQIDRGAATNADLLVVIGTLTNGGTLKVVNSGAEPQAGDSFNLFDGTNAGVFSAIVLPSLGSGTEWNTGTLYTTGVISVRDTTSPGDVTLFQAGRGAAYDQVELSWSNGATITVLACTNRTYLTSLSNWFVLASGVSTPWTHTTASNYPSVYYRIVSGRYTSSYDVGKFDVNIEPDSIAWLTFPFCVQPGCDTLSKWFARQLEARPQSSWDYATLQKQETPGGTIQNCDYYIDDFETGTTNWWPDNTIAANAGYYIDNWRSGATDFFPSMTGADMIEPGKAYLIFFSSARTGTGVWTCVKPY
jgi:autotransporter-associated beta strand protein